MSEDWERAIESSRMFSAERASPFERCAIRSRLSFDSVTWWVSLNVGFVKVFSRICDMFSSVKGFRTKTLERERRAEMTSKDGFSVVAPISVIVPLST